MSNGEAGIAEPVRSQRCSGAASGRMRSLTAPKLLARAGSLASVNVIGFTA